LKQNEKDCNIQREEFLFIYDIKNGNPNGDPDENRPRIDDVSNRCYVTDVRLKRFIRDYLIATEGEDSILVTKLGTKTVNLTDRVKDRLESQNLKERLKQENFMNILLDTFIDLRMFGSPLAFKDAPAEWKDKDIWKITGPIQINFGETLHQVEEITFHGTSTFRSKGEEKGQKAGTFTTYYGIPYGLIAFHGVVNEHVAEDARLSEGDLQVFKTALWKGVREASSANTRSKHNQQPHLLINIVYKKEIDVEKDGKKVKVPTEYHIGRLSEKVSIVLNEGTKEETSIRSLKDYSLNFTQLIDALKLVADKISKIEYCVSPEFQGRYADTIIAPLKKEFIKKVELVDLNIDRLG